MSGNDPRQDDEREQLLGALECDAGEALALARWMSAHPELSLKEPPARSSRRFPPMR